MRFLVGLVLAAGCTQILGVGGFHETGGGDDGGMTSDGGTDALAGACDPVAQVGCSGAQPRCTWIQDGASSGSDGCVDAGTVAVGGACGRDGASSGTLSWDNCDAGAFCIHGTCEQICNLALGSAACGGGDFCESHDGIFEANGSATAGLCDSPCDPLADNSFGSGGGDGIPPRTGTACGTVGDGFGCYGVPSFDASSPTHFTCETEGVTTDVHRSACLPGSGGSGCATGSGAFLNGCAQGYEPLLADTPGSTTVDCIAFCQPEDCYDGNCPDGAQGAMPHACSTADVRTAPGYNFPGTDATPPDLNQCIHLWIFEVDDNTGILTTSPYDEDGICYDDSLYPIMGSSGSFAVACDQLPGNGSAGPEGLNAAEVGCISIETAEALGDFGSAGFAGQHHRRLKGRPNLDVRFPSAPRVRDAH